MYVTCRRRGSLSPPVVAPAGALAVPVPFAGAAEGRWRPGTQTVAVALPHCQAGAGDVDLAPVASVISLNAAPSLAGPAGVRVGAAGLPPAACAVRRWDLADAPAQSPVVRPSPTTLAVGTVREPAVCFTAPETACLTVRPPSSPRATRRLPLGRRAAPEDVLRPTGGRVRSAPSVLAEVPLTRARRASPPGVPAAEAFAPERLRLAQSSGVSEEDIVLLGVFPQVPVAAVRRLALEEGGALSLWLKPEALAAAAAGKSPRLATLIVGRQRSTG